MQLSPGTSRRRLVDPTQPPTLIEPETAVLWTDPTVAASRPATPDAPTLHYATDTLAISLWDRTAWRAFSSGVTFPTATAAGQLLVATTSGTTYAARARILSGTLAARDALSPVYDGDEWYVNSGASSGTLWKRVNSAWQYRAMGTSPDDILTAIGGIKAPSSPSVGDVLTYDGSVWGAEPPGSAVAYTRTDYNTVVNDGSWELLAPAGGGTGAIAGGDIVLTQATSITTLGDAGRTAVRRGPGASTPSPLTAIADPFELDVVARIASFVGGDANTFGGFHLSSSTLTNELRFTFHPDGSAEGGYAGSSWSGGLGSAAAGTIGFDGTWWVRITTYGTIVILRYGQSTTTDPPGVSGWTTMLSADITTYLNNTRVAWDELGAYLTQYAAAPASDATLAIDCVRVTDRSSLTLT